MVRICKFVRIYQIHHLSQCQTVILMPNPTYSIGAAPGCDNQAPRMEHHLRWDEVWLLEVYDKPQPEVTKEIKVASARRLVGVRMSMNDVVNVRIHATCQ